MVRQKLKKVGIIHGLGGSSAIHWQTWLARQCNARGLDTYYPKLPRRFDRPRVDQWVTKIHRSLGNIDETTVLVGHSLGCPTILQVVLNNSRQLGMGILVAPSSLSRVQERGFEFLSSFYDGIHLGVNIQTLSYIAQKVNRWHVICSDNDPWVDQDQAYVLSNILSANFTLLRGAGHINVGSGFHTLSQVLDLITH